MQEVGGVVELCRSKGLRVTPQRLAVFQVLAESDGHLSVEEVWDHVRAGLPTVSLKTVYDALHELEAVGEIRLARFGSGSWRVERDPAHHHGHLVCDRCGAVCDVEADYPTPVVPPGQPGHFLVGRAEVVFAGLCDGCAEERIPAVDH
jgi:Fur family peroxide stress response transcriptional regulator